MSVRNAGSAIREARLKAGLSQEKLSDGVCSVLSLSRIENGTAGVSPSTFQALMTHAGAPCGAYPVFANRTDFDCFYILKTAWFYLDCWQLNEAYAELEKIEEKEFAQNKYYYQEWLLLHCKLQFRSGCANHQDTFNTLLDALNISRPNIDLFDFRELLLSVNEIKLLILIAQEALYLSKTDICLAICMQINSYLENSQITFLEKDLLLAENAIVYAKYLISIKDYSTALKTSDLFRQLMIKNANDAPLCELTFLTGLGHFFEKHNTEAMTYFKTAFFSAHSIGSCYATIIRRYLFDCLNVSLWEPPYEIDDIPLIPYHEKKAIDPSNFTDGTYDIFSPNTLTIGDLIRELRTEQDISQKQLCLGLCSKSKLSKIENGSLQPDIALAQSLLQRLGISDYAFTFYGNDHESKLQELRQQMTCLLSSNKSDILSYAEKIEDLCTKKDIFYIQYATYRKACCISDNEICAQELLAALKLTLPDFAFNQIHMYRLSWLELTILNNYCNVYCSVSPSQGILYLYKLLEYCQYNNLHILEKRRTFAISLCFLSGKLYKQKRFAELAELSPYLYSPILRCSLRHIGVFLANYAQALGEIEEFDTLQTYASYAYYNLLIVDSNNNAALLKDYIYTDFKINLL